MNDVINKILSVSNEELDAIDLSRFLPYVNNRFGYSQYFLKDSGIEHYRLLAYISMLYKKSHLLDVGTNLGFSALALSFNRSNIVTTYDIIKQEMFDEYEMYTVTGNVQFLLGNFLKRKDFNKIPFIFLDTAHEGPFEKQVIEHLKNIGWVGILGMDDIFEYKPLTDLWNSLDLEKYDLTSKGHCTGTGFIVFN